MRQIDYYLALQSPYVYLAGTRPAEIAARHGATLVYKPLDAAQLFPRTGGKIRAERHPARNDYSAQDRMRQARKLAMPYDPQPLYAAANPAPAAYAVIAAQKVGGGDLSGLVAAFSRAMWAESRDISDDEVIRALLTAHGFAADTADKYMLAAADTYAANLEEAVSNGVFGVPFFIAGDQKFWGQDRLEDLDLHLSGKL